MVRQRKKTNKKEKAGNNKTSTSTPTSSRSKRAKDVSEGEAKKGEHDETLKDVFNSHPIGKALQLFLLPYGLYRAYYVLQLQHPEYLGLRPALQTSDPRQLLIVAAPFSRNNKITAALRQSFQLEIGHETSDTTWNFARDGTVSWFHGIRFFHDIVPTKSLADLCKKGEMGFHPSNYPLPDNKCSSSNAWDDCWQLACVQTVYREWGCSNTVSSSSEVTTECDTKFEYVLHQVQNPMRTLEAFTSEYCPEGLNEPADEGFFTYATALFPNRDFTDYSCLEAAGYFLVDYHNTMIQAEERGEIDSYYRIEDSSPCDVARLGGLLDRPTTIYEAHVERIQGLCEKVDEGAMTKASIAAQTAVRQQTDTERSLGWKDLRGGMHGSKRKTGNKDLEQKFRRLFHSFGYDETLESEEIVKGSEFDS